MEPQTSKLAPHHTTFLIAAVIIGIIILGGIFIALYGSRQVQVPKPQEVQKDQAPTPSEQAIPLPTSPVPPPTLTNPVEDLTKTNPFETQTNPFETGYKNPFE